MKRRFLLSMGAWLLVGTLAAQTSAPEWQAGVERLKGLIKENPAAASTQVGELLKGKNKRDIALLTSVARLYLDAGHLSEAESYLAAAQKADAKDANVSLLEGDIALARKEVGKACQLYEQAIYFDPQCKAGLLNF